MNKLQPCTKNQIAEIELVYKSKVPSSDCRLIECSSDAYKILIECWNLDKVELLEQFMVLLLNHANRVIARYLVSTGGITGTVADPRLIFTAALKTKSTSIVLAHNHPSGNLKPSTADKELTQKIKKGGELLDIKLLDHIIVSKEAYFSFADEGLI